MPAVLDPLRTAAPDVDTLQELWDGSPGNDDGECHLAMSGDSEKALCGFKRKSENEACDGDWKGETICPKCHKVVCPECIAIANKILGDAAEDL